MDKRIFLILAISLIFLWTAISQDSSESSESETLEIPGAPSVPQGLYKEPRWVSWPSASLGINLLGIAQAGPVIQVEINLAGSMYLVPSFRYNYLGYASHQLMNALEEDSEYSPGSFSGGLGIRQFLGLQKKNRLVFVGLFGEYSIDKATYNLESSWESERERNAVNVLANVGYRWWFRKDFFVHLGIYGGLSIELKDESRYLLGAYKGDLEKDYQNNPFVGLIDFTVGWNL